MNSAEWIEQWICIKFCIKFEHSSGHYSDDAEGRSYGQLVIGSFIITMCPFVQNILCRVFCKTSNHPADSAPLQPRFGALWLLAFPKTIITFEREEISDCQWDSGKYDGAADGDWENCVRSQGAYFEGDWGIIALCTIFLVSCIFFSKCLYFSYYIAGYLLERPHILGKTISTHLLSAV